MYEGCTTRPTAGCSRLKRGKMSPFFAPQLASAINPCRVTCPEQNKPKDQATPPFSPDAKPISPPLAPSGQQLPQVPPDPHLTLPPVNHPSTWYSSRPASPPRPTHPSVRRRRQPHIHRHHPVFGAGFCPTVDLPSLPTNHPAPLWALETRDGDSATLILGVCRSPKSRAFSPGLTST